jgi:hypothetical protein
MQQRRSGRPRAPRSPYSDSPEASPADKPPTRRAKSPSRRQSASQSDSASEALSAKSTLVVAQEETQVEQVTQVQTRSSTDGVDEAPVLRTVTRNVHIKRFIPSTSPLDFTASSDLSSSPFRGWYNLMATLVAVFLITNAIENYTEQNCIISNHDWVLLSELLDGVSLMFTVFSIMQLLGGLAFILQMVCVCDGV